jgi:hypothetical protein
VVLFGTRDGEAMYFEGRGIPDLQSRGARCRGCRATGAGVVPTADSPWSCCATRDGNGRKPPGSAGDPGEPAGGAAARRIEMPVSFHVALRETTRSPRPRRRTKATAKPWWRVPAPLGDGSGYHGPEGRLRHRARPRRARRPVVSGMGHSGVVAASRRRRRRDALRRRSGHCQVQHAETGAPLHRPPGGDSANRDLDSARRELRLGGRERRGWHRCHARRAHRGSRVGVQLAPRTRWIDR